MLEQSVLPLCDIKSWGSSIGNSIDTRVAEVVGYRAKRKGNDMTHYKDGFREESGESKC